MDPTQPQAAQMADESMVRNLASQAECIWPQERELIEAYGLPPRMRALDVGCGTGEITERLARERPGAQLIGVDLIEAHLVRARERCVDLAGRVAFRTGDAFALDFEDGAFDLVLCRHVLQAVTEPERALAELVRVLRPGGVLHLLVEDYGMMHFPDWGGDLGAGDGATDPDRFWLDGPIAFAARTGTDLRIGRKAYTLLRRLGLERARVDYVTVDPLRAPREAFARTWTAWRDGYAEAIARATGLDLARVRAHFDAMTAVIQDGDGYAVWQIPIVSGRRPGAGAAPQHP